VIRGRLFNIASALSLILCLYCVWYGMNLYTLWRHGYIAEHSEVVVHDPQLGRQRIIYLWVAIPFASLPMAWFGLRLRKSYREFRFREQWRPGLCEKCFYQLRANTSGVCPECATKIAEVRRT